MVSKRDGFLVLWPIYFDSDKSRRSGRRVPEKYAVPSPSAADIGYICEKVRLTPLIDRAAHPSRPWERCDRVLVRKPTIKGKRISKQRLLKILGKRLRIWFDKTTKKKREKKARSFLDKVEFM